MKVKLIGMRTLRSLWMKLGLLLRSNGFLSRWWCWMMSGNGSKMSANPKRLWKGIPPFVIITLYHSQTIHGDSCLGGKCRVQWIIRICGLLATRVHDIFLPTHLAILYSLIQSEPSASDGNLVVLMSDTLILDWCSTLLWTWGIRVWLTMKLLYLWCLYGTYPSSGGKYEQC